ncbi:MAG: 50S ribosomal protein L28 [Candidatus Omnitrophica bacterium]|nr:50S ribosomal protein L28 [Candidatus Omnitrophota bacterium]
MSRVCFICGKRTETGRTITRRGKAKRYGGVGEKITGITNRRFMPNLQPVKTVIDGKNKKVRVCVKCLKAGKVVKATRMPKPVVAVQA